jgi:hypothetical protein
VTHTRKITNSTFLFNFQASKQKAAKKKQLENMGVETG